MATVTIANTTANLSGKTVVLAERDHTITGTWTFSRSPSAPFVVQAASANVPNLDADMVDGLHAASFATLTGGKLPVASGGTNSSTALNNNRVMVSSGGAVVEAAAATNGQLLIGSTGAAPVIAAITAGTGISVTNGAGTITIANTIPNQTILLKAGSGTSTAAGATNVDTIALTGLTALDTLLVFLTFGSVTQACGRIDLVSSTDANGVVAAVTATAGINAGETYGAQASVFDDQSGATAYVSLVSSYGNSGGNKTNAITFAATTAWTGSWTLALRHGGVTAGGTFRYRWSVYKVAGQ